MSAMDGYRSLSPGPSAPKEGRRRVSPAVWAFGFLQPLDEFCFTGFILDDLPLATYPMLFTK